MSSIRQKCKCKKKKMLKLTQRLGKELKQKKPKRKVKQKIGRQVMVRKFSKKQMADMMKNIQKFQ